MAADRVFIDTNVLVAASVEAHPSHAVATALLERLARDGARACISTQVCREFLAVLTRGPVEGRTFGIEEALAALDAWTSACELLDDGEPVLPELLDLVRRFSVRGKQVHDANVVATMRAHGLTTLATLNGSDFRRFDELISLAPLVS
jgi:toxin-antitoxin system PIN domain toxin